jgi:chromate transporter
MTEPGAARWREIVTGFLKLGATAYGGPAIMGVMQAEFQELRQWVSRARFLEGLALVNVLPGASATQLGIVLGYARGGWWGGLLAGLCFAAPGFVVMLALAAAYASLGVSPLLRGALYGLGPLPTRSPPSCSLPP